MFKKLASAVVETIHDAHESDKAASGAPPATSGKTASNKVTVCVRVRPKQDERAEQHPSPTRATVAS